MHACDVFGSNVLETAIEADAICCVSNCGKLNVKVVATEVSRCESFEKSAGDVMTIPMFLFW